MKVRCVSAKCALIGVDQYEALKESTPWSPSMS